MTFSTLDAAAQAGAGKADALFEEGKVLLARGDWEGGCKKFEQSQALDASVSTQVKIARCREREGRLLLALAEYEQATSLNRTRKQAPGRAEELQKVIDAAVLELTPRIPSLRLAILDPPANVEVRIGERRIPAEALSAPISVDPGEHEIEVLAPGYRPERVRRKFEEEKTVALDVELVPIAMEEKPAGKAREASAAPPRTVDDRASSSETGMGAQRVIGLSLGGAGVLSFGVAAYFGVRTLSLVEESDAYCDPDGTCDPKGIELRGRATDQQTFGLIFAGAGAALLGTGIALFVTARPEHGATGTPRPNIGVTLHPGGAALRGSF